MAYSAFGHVETAGKENRLQCEGGQVGIHTSLYLLICLCVETGDWVGAIVIYSPKLGLFSEWFSRGYWPSHP